MFDYYISLDKNDNFVHLDTLKNFVKPWCVHVVWLQSHDLLSGLVCLLHPPHRRPRMHVAFHLQLNLVKDYVEYCKHQHSVKDLLLAKFI